MRWVGLDVHAHASAMAVFDDVTGEVSTRRVTGRPMEVLDVLRELPGPVRAVYEAGPTGYGLVRRARAGGIEMAVCSPGNIERRPGDRTQARQARRVRLARRFAAGDLKLVWIPSPEQEQLRDLVRCREDLRADLMRARHRLATVLLRRERSFPGPGGRWTLKHRDWLSQQRFDDPASRITCAEYLHAHDVLLAAATASAASSRRSPRTASGPRRSRSCAVCAPSRPWPRSPCARRSVTGGGSITPTRSPATSAWSRPSTAPQTPTGWARSPRPAPAHARRLLVEAALHYRLAPSVGGKLAARQRGQDPALIDHAWRIQRRLNAHWNLLRTGRGQARRSGDDRDRPRTRRQLLGDRHGSQEHFDITSDVSRRRDGPGTAHTRTAALSPVSQPPRRRRSIADSGRCDQPRS